MIDQGEQSSDDKCNFQRSLCNVAVFDKFEPLLIVVWQFRSVFCHQRPLAGCQVFCFLQSVNQQDSTLLKIISAQLI